MGQKPDLLSTLVKKSSTTATGINTNKKAKHLQKASRTTVLNNKNKITRQLPGPLLVYIMTCMMIIWLTNTSMLNMKNCTRISRD